MRKYPNLTKQLELTAPEQLWVADITYLQTVSSNAYLHLVTDACSKQIMGYEPCTDMKTSSTKKALKMTSTNKEYTHKLIHHSDRGLQYCYYNYIRLLVANNIEISMTENGDPYENAIAERVNGILKDEFGLDQVFQSHEQFKQHVDHAIEIYNTFRPHCSIELLTSKQAHARTTLKVKRWQTKAPSKLIYDGAI
jgi:putative transposase